MRNILYWLGSRGLWRYAYTHINTHYDQHTFANKYSVTNCDADEYCDSNTDEHACPNEYCDGNSNSDSNGNTESTRNRYVSE